MYNCDRCRNKGICKFECRAKELEDDMRTYFETIAAPDGEGADIFGVSIRCSKFFADRKNNKVGARKE